MREKVIAGVIAHSVVVSAMFYVLPSWLMFLPVVVLLVGSLGGAFAVIKAVEESNDHDEAKLEDKAITEHEHSAAFERELKELRKRQEESANDLKARIAELQNSKEQAASDRERLMAGLKDAGAADDDDAGVTMILEGVQRLADKAEHEHHDVEAEELAEELAAAEELLREVEQQRAELEKTVKDSSAEMYNLKATVEAATRKSFEARARTMMLTRSNVKKTDVIAKRMEDMLKSWIKKEDLNVNFSEHGHAIDVQNQFEKIDQEFVTRYFTHITNPEYERGQHRIIRVNEELDPDGSKYGELVVSLDDDKGRTLGLRFDVRKQAPDIKAVGFVLAMYLRAMTRDFRDFGIKV
ncbi:MAG: hypothetical protein ACYTDT_08870 [Planctomycetota bacterium]|jgi:chromosome segregation ATPase